MGRSPRMLIGGTSRAQRQRAVLLAGALGGALALVAGACGGSTRSASDLTSAPVATLSGSPAAAATVRDAPVSTARSGTADVMVLVASDERVNGSGPLSVDVTEDADLGGGDGTGTMVVAGLPAASNPGPLHLVFTEDGVYLQTTGRFASLGEGKPWAKIDPLSLGSLFADASSAGAGPLNALAAACIGQPTAVLDLLQTPALRAARVGTASIGSTTATEYRVMVVPKVAARSASGPAAALFASLGSTVVEGDVWLDDAGRLVQFEVGGPAPSTASGGPASAGRITGVLVRLDDFGTPVAVTVPPASEVAVPGPLAGHAAPAGQPG